jgi:hypothetical protein
MKPLTFYIVFHKNLFESNTAGFTDAEKAEMLCWVGVNEKVLKEVPAWLTVTGAPILYEYEMRNYSPLYQMSNFYQNSVFFHLYENQHLLTSKYIGFGQYDMSYDVAEFRKMYKDIDGDNGDKLFPAFLFGFEHLFGVLDEHGWEQFFIKPYNEFYGTRHTLESLGRLPLFLMHTFVMPTWYFLHMMRFVKHLLPTTLSSLNWDTRHLAGTLERVFALCMSAAVIEGKFKAVIPLKGCNHDTGQRVADTMRGIAAGPASGTA